MNNCADLVVIGTIYTAEDNKVCEAFAVKDGKYVYVGGREGVEPYIEKGITKVIDKGNNGLVIPGCTEGHGHFIGIDGLVRNMPAYYVDFPELFDILREKVEKEKPEQFLSWGFDYLKIQANHEPSRSYAQEIEDIAPGIPVLLFDTSGHQAICNITALKKSGLYETKKVKGGNVFLDDKGNANGIITDEAVPYVIERAFDMSKIDAALYRKACRMEIDTLHKRGYTNYYDAYINYLTDNQFYKYIKELDDAGELGINMVSTHTLRSYDDASYKEKIDHINELSDEYGSEHFNPRNLKLFADGITEALSGWTIEEYPNAAPGKEHGNIIWSQEELKTLILYANSKGLPVHTHTFGDGACRAVIDAYVNANAILEKKTPNSLAHVRNITKEDIVRCAENGIGIAENLDWHNDNLPKDDAEYNEYIASMNAGLPKGIYETGYPMKSLIEAGVNVTSSTDAPCSEAFEGNIMNIIEVAVTGIEPGQDFRPFNPSELVSVRQALDCMTINGAKQLGIEDKCGSIKVGKNADFVILDTNFLDYEGEQLKTIHNARVLEVYFEGNKVYNS